MLRVARVEDDDLPGLDTDHGRDARGRPTSRNRERRFHAPCGRDVHFERAGNDHFERAGNDARAATARAQTATRHATA